MAAAILEQFDAGTEVSLIEGGGGDLDVAIDLLTITTSSVPVVERKVVYSKKDLGILKVDEVDETEVCDAIFAKVP